MKKGLSYLFVLSLALTGTSCFDDAPCTKKVPASAINAVNQTQLAADIEAIDTYLDDEGIIAVEDPTGLRYVIETQGDGKKPCLESYVAVTYKGMLLSNGNVFDQAINPVQFPLNNLILGWQIAFIKFPVGTKATLYIPSGLAYGNRIVGSIPANSNLIFEVELLGVN